MANAYYNLAGWLRDVRSVLGDRTELADSYYWQLRDLVEEVLELVDGADESAPDESEPEDAQDELVESDPGGRVVPRPAGRRPRAGSKLQLGGSAPVGDPPARDVQEVRRRGNGDTVTMARTGGEPGQCAGVKRVATVEMSLEEATALKRAASVPRGTRSRVTKRTKPKVSGRSTPVGRRGKVSK